MDAQPPNYHAEVWKSPHHAALGLLPSFGFCLSSRHLLQLRVGSNGRPAPKLSRGGLEKPASRGAWPPPVFRVLPLLTPSSTIKSRLKWTPSPQIITRSSGKARITRRLASSRLSGFASPHAIFYN